MYYEHKLYYYKASLNLHKTNPELRTWYVIVKLLIPFKMGK